MKNLLLLAGIMLVTACTKTGISNDLGSLKVGQKAEVEGTVAALTQRGFILTDSHDNNAYVYVGPDFDFKYYNPGDHVTVKADVAAYRDQIELQNADVKRIESGRYKYPAPIELSEKYFEDYISSTRPSEYICSTGKIVSNQDGSRLYLAWNDDYRHLLEFEFPVIDIKQYLDKSVRIEGYSLWPKEVTQESTALCVVLTNVKLQ